MTDMKKWLTEEEIELYELLFTYPDRPIHRKRKVAYESLAACRRLLSLNQWCGDYTTGEMFCPECHDHPHSPDCAIATALKGVGGGKDAKQ